jgi:hypothetical protein
MPKQTIQVTLCKGLLALGCTELSATTKYRRFLTPTGGFAFRPREGHYFVGSAGALRFSSSGRVGDTIVIQNKARNWIMQHGQNPTK